MIEILGDIWLASEIIAVLVNSPDDSDEGAWEVEVVTRTGGGRTYEFDSEEECRRASFDFVTKWRNKAGWAQ